MGWSWSRVAGVVADVGITAACTAVLPIGGEAIGGFFGGAVNGLINGDSAGEAFSVDGGLGMIGGGVGGFVGRQVAKGVEKSAATGLKDALGKDVLGNNWFGFATEKAPGRLDVWPSNSALSLAGRLGDRAPIIAARSGFRGVAGAAVTDFGSNHGRENLGIGGTPSPTGSSSGSPNGTTSGGGPTPLQWYTGTTAQVTGVLPVIPGTPTVLVIPKNADTATNSSYQQLGSVIDAGWQSAGNIKSGTDSASSVFPEATV